jgi:TM2 domain-containing membrane protein YozV
VSQSSVPPPSAPPAAHAIPTEPCDACGQLVDFRAKECPRCGFVLAAGAPKLARPGRKVKSPRTATWLSLSWPGAGHFYAGDAEKGLIFSVAAAILCGLSLTIVGPLLGLVLWLGLALYTAIDCARALA